MIVSNTHKFLYFGLPRTASTSMHEWLAEWGYRRGHQHDVKVPSGCENYLKWTIVRNPYDRAVSLWYMAQSQVRHGYMQSAPYNTPTFLEFLEKVIADEKEISEYSFYATKQVDFFREVKPDVVLKFEDLPMCLWTLPFVEGNPIPPKVNTIDMRAWETYFTHKEEALAWKIYQEDFETYGYKRFNQPVL